MNLNVFNIYKQRALLRWIFDFFSKFLHCICTHRTHNERRRQYNGEKGKFFVSSF